MIQMCGLFNAMLGSSMYTVEECRTLLE